MKGIVRIYTNEIIHVVDYICFNLINGSTATTDHEYSYTDFGYVEGKLYPCFVMVGCKVKLGRIPLISQIGKIKGINEIQTYDIDKDKEYINHIKIIGIMFEENGVRTWIGKDHLEYELMK